MKWDRGGADPLWAREVHLLATPAAALQVNKAVVDNTALVNESPEDKAWFVKLEPAALGAETPQLLDSAAYEALCKAEKH